MVRGVAELDTTEALALTHIGEYGTCVNTHTHTHTHV